MKKKLLLTTSVQNPGMLESIVEELACKRNDNDYVATIVPKTWQAIETSSVETFISGTINISEKSSKTAHIPFTSSFLFSCTREKNLPYKMRWWNSLS